MKGKRVSGQVLLKPQLPKQIESGSPSNPRFKKNRERRAYEIIKLFKELNQNEDLLLQSNYEKLDICEKEFIQLYKIIEDILFLQEKINELCDFMSIVRAIVRINKIKEEFLRMSKGEEPVFPINLEDAVSANYNAIKYMDKNKKTYKFIKRNNELFEKFNGEKKLFEGASDKVKNKIYKGIFNKMDEINKDILSASKDKSPEEQVSFF